MIATGLCVMGGCFAMDNGAAVDTYWPSAAAEISPDIPYGLMLTIPVRGGDAENDSMSFGAVIQNNVSATDWHLATGFNRDDKASDGRLGVTVHPVEAGGEAGLYMTYGTYPRVVVWPGFDATNVTAVAHNGSCSFSVNGEVAGEWTSKYSLKDEAIRNVYVRSVITRVFHWLAYRNARTNVCFYISAMKSASGAAALYSDYDMTLVEV